MSVPFYVVDAFTNKTFGGNPAAICLFDTEPDDGLRRRLAIEFNLSETAFPRPIGSSDFRKCSRFGLRWFTPKTEVPLCGHATLATAHTLFNEIGLVLIKFIYFEGNINDNLEFETKSGVLRVRKCSDGKLEMDFPAYKVFLLDSSPTKDESFETINDPNEIGLLAAKIQLGNLPIERIAYAPEAKKLIVQIHSDTKIENLRSMELKTEKIFALDPNGDFLKGMIVTLKGNESDYECRYFSPWYGIAEDPATGSAQCAVGPFWAKILNKTSLSAIQCFPGRGAEFSLAVGKERVRIGGNAVTVFSGHFRPMESERPF